MKIGRAERERSRNRKGTPGPGSYSPRIIKFKNSKRTKYSYFFINLNSFRIGRDRRRPMSASTSYFNPGPGTYETK